MSRILLCFALLLLHCLANAQQDTIEAVISTSSDSVNVDLRPFSLRSANFGVFVQLDNGSLVSFPAAAEPHYWTYLGTVRDHPGAMAVALANRSGSILLARISFENGLEWSLNSPGSFANVRGNLNWKPNWPTTSVPLSEGNSEIREAEVAVDATYQQYLAARSDINSTIAMIEYSIMSANMPFLRDASIFHKLGKLVIRASKLQDPYKGSKSTKVLLGGVRREWNSVIRGIVGRTQHLTLVVLPGAGGGLAYVKTVAGSWAYSANGANANGDFSVLWRHEAGHNWGSVHYEGGGRPEGPTIMSGNKLSRFSSSELAKILSYKLQLKKVLPISQPLARPPRANMDTVPLGTTSNPSPIFVDVMGNDLDDDFDGLQLVWVQNPSSLNSTVQINPSSGSSLRDLVAYSPSPAASAASALDYFTYRIRNSHGKTATGYVVARASGNDELLMSS